MGEVSLHSGSPINDLYQAGFSGKSEELISLLQYYQKTYGYISQEGVREIAEFLKVSEAHIYGVASFYAQFRFTKPAENILRVCLGTACHVQGGEQLSVEIEDLIGVGPGQVSPDGRFELQQVACLGCCAQAPVVEINGKVYGKMTADKLRKVMRQYEEL
jgi:NADH-quinone oxidoreductase subunit E